MRLLDANMRDVSDVEVKQGKNKVPNLLPPEVKNENVASGRLLFLWLGIIGSLLRDINATTLFKAFCEQV